MAPRKLEGKTALITGAARGIGRATALSLVQAGVRTALTDVDELALERTHAALAEVGAPVVAHRLDVADRSEFESVVARVEDEIGPLDILVNNAGIMGLGRFVDTNPDLDDRMIDINLRGVIHGARVILPRFETRQRGHLVNIASTAGKIGAATAGVYCATKHAVIGLSEALVKEYETSPIDISYVMPGLVRTELTAGTKPMRYPPPLTPEQVADAIVDALKTGRIDVYVPNFARSTAILPAWLPRSIMRRIERWFGIDEMFDVEPDERRAYRERISR